ncbi:tetratricopeptide repeat protein [Bacillus alkalicellulosilyticus]|uniref:tetratricopeptide repeat protein n=1 Tax=Alkalihalobacterium alkalicellulosilyticum TaxID=1912214 RepID=UPI000998D499|nr:tetratricopeptide repeat protein [Bacillus alkalicellulosilyticus]
MSINIEITTQKEDIKKAMEDGRYDLAIPLVNQMISEIKAKKSYSYIKHVLSMIQEEDVLPLLRALDGALLHSYGNFIIRYLAKHMNTTLIQILLCDEWSERGKVLEAEEKLFEILESKDSLDHKMLKRIYSILVPLLIEMKRFREAESFLQKHEEISQEPILDHWGYFYFHSGQWEKAVEVLERGSKEDKQPQYCYMMLHVIMLSQGDIEKALQYVSTGIEKVPFFLPLYIERMKRLRQLERWDEFLQTSDELDKLSPHHTFAPFLQYTRAQAYYAQGDFEAFRNIVDKNTATFKGSVYQTCTTYNPNHLTIVPTVNVVQKYNYCVPATLSMILQRNGISIDQDEISDHIFEVNGTQLLKAVDYLQAVGMTCQFFFGNIDRYKELTQKNVSVMISVDYPNSSHVQLLKGYDDNLQAFYIIDPNSPETIVIGYEDFMKYYGKNQCLSMAIVSNSSEMPSLLSSIEHEIVTRVYKLANRLENFDDSTKESDYQFFTQHRDYFFVSIYLMKLFFDGDRDNLHTTISDLQEKLPDSDYIHLICAHTYVKVKEYERATQLLASVKQKETHLYHYLLGRIAYEQERYEEATPHFRKALNVEPDHYDTWSYLSLSSYFSGETQKAFTYADISTDINDKDYWNRMNVGLLLIEEKRYEEARALYHTILKEYKQYAQAWYERAYCDQALSRFSHAIRGYKVARELMPDVPLPYRDLAMIYVHENNNEEAAIQELSQGLEQVGEDFSLLMTLAEIYENSGKLEEAEQHYLRAFSCQPENPYPLLSLIGIYGQNNEHEKAIALLENHYPSFQTDSTFLIHAGEWLVNHSQHETEAALALEWLEAGISYTKSNVEGAWDLYVQLLEYTEHNERARLFLDSQKAKYPNSVDLLCYIGCLFERAEQLDQAIHLYEQALEIEEHYFPYYRLGEVAFTQEQYEEAISFYALCLAQDATVASCYFRLAEIYNRLEDSVNEQQYLFLALEHAPLEVTLPHFIEISHAVGKLADVRDYFERNEGNLLEPWRLDALAYIAKAEGNIKLAESFIKQGLDLDPEAVPLLDHLADIYLTLNRFKEAQSIAITQIEKDVEHRHMYSILLRSTMKITSMYAIKDILKYLEQGENFHSNLYMYMAYEVEQILSERMESYGTFRRLLHMKGILKMEALLIELYNKAIEQNNSQAVIWLSEYHKGYEEFEEAREVLERFLERNWDSEVARYYIDHILNGTSNAERNIDLKLVESVISRCVEEDPNEIQLQIQLATFYYQYNRLKESERLFQTIINENPDYIDAYYEYSRFCEYSGQYQQGENVIKQAITLDPSNAFLYNQLSILEHRQGKTKEALQTINTSIETDSEFLLGYYNKACYLAVLQDVDESLRTLEYVIENDPDSPYFKQLAQTDPDLNNIKQDERTAQEVKQLLK